MRRPPSQPLDDLSENTQVYRSLKRRIAVAHKFEIYKDKKGEFRVRFKYNSEIMFSTEGYSSKSSAQNAIKSIQKNGPDAPVEDNS
jgi:hypothetical protein